MTRFLALCLILSAARGAAQESKVTIEANGKLLLLSGERTRFDDPPLEASQRDGVVTIRNTGRDTFKLGKCSYPFASMRMWSPDTVMLAMTGWQESSRVWPVTSQEPRKARTFAVLWSPSSRLATLIGFTTFDRATTEVETAPGKDGGLVASAWTDFEGLPLAPGASIESEKLVVLNGANPEALIDSWTSLVQAHYKPTIWPTNPGGWVGWSWVDPFNVERYEDVVRRNAAAIRRRLPGFKDLSYIWISLGNLENREPGNWLRWNYKWLPSGPKKLVADLAEQGYKLGLWAGAFWLGSGLKADIARLGDARLRRNGEPIVVKNPTWGDVFVLDPTHPKTKDHLTQVFRTWREWGIRYYMLDFLYAISGAMPGSFIPDSYHDTSLPRVAAYREGLRAIREASGKDTYLLASTGPTLQNIGLLDAMRAGNDYGEGRPLDGPGKGFYPGTFVINRTDHWTSHERALHALAAHAPMHRKLFIADSGNVLTVDKPVPLDDARISATIFAINGGPLMLGDDIDRMSEDRIGIVRGLFPRLPEAARALDLFASPAPGYPKVFRLPVRTAWDEWDLYAVFNLGDEPLRQRIELGAGERLVWDFWSERYLGARSGGWEAVVSPHSVGFYRVAARRAHPWILSTDLHARQGQAELENVHWNPERKELEIEARRPAGSEGNVFMWAPSDAALLEPAGLWIAKDGHNGSLIIRASLRFDAQGKARRVVRFR